MNILKAALLESPHAVLDRFLFRLLWCSVGAAVALAVLRDVRSQMWFLICAIIGVSSLGAIADSYRLKHPHVSEWRLRLLMAAVIFLTLVAYFHIRFGTK